MYIKDLLQGKKDSRKGKQRINVEKIVIGLQHWKLKLKRGGGNSIELQEPNIEAEVYNNNTKRDWGKKKSLKSLIRFPSANKINYNKGGKKRGKKRKEKKSKRLYRTSQNIRIINVFLESLLSESFPSVGVTVQLASLRCPPTLCWSLHLLWGELRF